MSQRINQLINDGGVFRTALATLGLLKRSNISLYCKCKCCPSVIVNLDGVVMFAGEYKGRIGHQGGNGNCRGK